MTNEEIIEALRNNPENKTAYMNELYNQNKGLIYKIALKHTEKVDIEDLMQEAYFKNWNRNLWMDRQGFYHRLWKRENHVLSAVP